jgi:hypothetical protein
VPSPDTLPQTYKLLLRIGHQDGAQPVHRCGDHQRLRLLPPAPVVRVMGIDAGFTERSYSPGALARLHIATDVPSFTLQFFQAGPETQPTAGTAMEGVPVSRTPPGRLVVAPQRAGNDQATGRTGSTSPA